MVSQSIRLFQSFKRVNIFVLVVVFIGVFIFLKGVWLPWVSPKIATKYLLLDDGKDPFNASRSAALYWGSEIYIPLKLKSDRFNNLSWIANNTLLDILEADSNPPDWLKFQLSESKLSHSNILYCYLILRSKELDKKYTECENIVRKFATDVSLENTGEEYLSKKVLIKIDGYSRVNNLTQNSE